MGQSKCYPATYRDEMNQTNKSNRWILIIKWGLIIIVFIELSWLGILRYRCYEARMLDLGTISQAIWNATQGKPLEYTSENGYQASRLGGHAEVIYFLIAPLYSLWPSPALLPVIQALLFVIGGIPLFNLAKRRLKNSYFALVFLFIYLFYPLSQNIMLLEFHGDALAIPILIFAFDALDRQSVKEYTLWIILALLCKEYVFIPIGLFGVILWIKNKNKLSILTLILASLGGIGMVLLKKFFGNWGADIETKTSVSFLMLVMSTIEFYFGNIREIFVPKEIIARGISIFFIFLPISLLIWDTLIWVIPGISVLLLVLLSTAPPSFHHYSLIIPFLMLASIHSSEKALINKSSSRISLQAKLFGTALLTFAFFLLFSFTPISPLAPHTVSDKCLAKCGLPWQPCNLPEEIPVSMIPDDARVYSDALMATHLTNRQFLGFIISTKLTPRDIFTKYDYILLNENSFYFEPHLYQWTMEEAWCLLYMENGLFLFSRPPCQINSSTTN